MTLASIAAYYTPNDDNYFQRNVYVFLTGYLDIGVLSYRQTRSVVCVAWCPEKRKFCKY